MRKSFSLCTVRCTGLPPGGSLASVPWTGQWSTWPGRFHMVLFTLPIVWSLLAMTMTPTVFVALQRPRLTYSLNVLLPRVSLVGFSLLCFVLRPRVPLCCVVMSSGFSASELAVVPHVLVYLLNLTKWSGNSYCFCEVCPGVLPLMKVIKARTKCHLILFFKRFKSSRCQRYNQLQKWWDTPTEKRPFSP